ncbi:unnamed protein product [Adineta steineri]|uniref:Uncharacterized protein n=1 Tax=Adineta steineri TaxID=433720 RepID=A0A814U464_9BILA|nr:unnamed protein product [Adineta steineri]CAF3623186.1 unnamed protein product [Adineta steineri]
MSYRFAYPNGGATLGYSMDPTLMSAGYPSAYDDHQRSYSPESFSSESESDDSYEYRGRMITRDSRCSRDVVRARTPPPIIKRVVERAPTPEALVMERVIIRPQPQEIVERVIEQPRTPPPRIIQKEMHEEAPPPIVRTRVIKVDRPVRSGYSQPGSPYGNPCNALPSFSNGMIAGGGGGYRSQSIAGSVGRPSLGHGGLDPNTSFSSESSFEYIPQTSMTSGMPPPSSAAMMMLPASSQQQQQSMGLMQQQQPVQQQQLMYRPVQMQSAIPPIPSSYMPQNYMYPMPRPGMSFGYHPMMQHGRMIPSGMPMIASGNSLGPPTSNFSNQLSLFNPMAQQMVY